MSKTTIFMLSLLCLDVGIDYVKLKTLKKKSSIKTIPDLNVKAVLINAILIVLRNEKFEERKINEQERELGSYN